MPNRFEAIAWCGFLIGCLPCASAYGSEFWISASSFDPFTASGGRVPAIDLSEGAMDETLYVWGRPDAGKTLRNLSLNLRSSDSAVIDFKSVLMHNPILGADVRRYEFIANPAPMVAPADAEDRIDNMLGFNVANELVTGLGMGPGTTSLDPLYRAEDDAWLIATVTFDVTGSGSETTQLYLQIGENGLNHMGFSSSEASVVLGDPTDPTLNGRTDREIDSATEEATLSLGGLLGDLNDDGAVDAADAGQMFSSWGSVSSGNVADLNADALVDAADAGILFSNWTGDARNFQPVPEPALPGLMRMGLMLGLFIAFDVRRIRSS